MTTRHDGVTTTALENYVAYFQAELEGALIAATGHPKAFDYVLTVQVLDRGLDAVTMNALV